ncbi:MAG TPA: hypothetical protein DF698_09820 [Candidatus Atribacteria bacterium]|nr:hypothetical protein [Candidatus Atribacteria bacterium]
MDIFCLYDGIMGNKLKQLRMPIFKPHTLVKSQSLYKLVQIVQAAWAFIIKTYGFESCGLPAPPKPYA